MEIKEIRKEIKRVLEELFQANHNVYATSVLSGKGFPYDDGETIHKLPEEISIEDQYVFDYDAFSNNDDLYDFPWEEFKLGLKVEKDRNNQSNTIGVAKIVINKLGEEPHFYSSLASGDKTL